MIRSGLHRVSFAVLAALALTSAAGCPAPAPAPAPPSGVAPTPTPTPAPDGDLTADGQHFATTRNYRGDCAPAGSRGGCHAYTFEPDGTYKELLYDAMLGGHYVIDGDAVSLTPNGDAMPARLVLSADRATLGDGFQLQP